MYQIYIEHYIVICWIATFQQIKLSLKCHLTLTCGTFSMSAYLNIYDIYVK